VVVVSVDGAGEDEMALKAEMGAGGGGLPAWLDWSAPKVRTLVAPSASAWPRRYSSLRVLLPPMPSPVQSSRLMKMVGAPRAALKRSQRSRAWASGESDAGERLSRSGSHHCASE